MVTAAILMFVGLGLGWVVVPLVRRDGLTITTPGGLIACVSTAAAAALLAGGVAAVAGAL